MALCEFFFKISSHEERKDICISPGTRGCGYEPLESISLVELVKLNCALRQFSPHRSPSSQVQNPLERSPFQLNHINIGFDSAFKPLFSVYGQ